MICRRLRLVVKQITGDRTQWIEVGLAGHRSFCRLKSTGFMSAITEGPVRRRTATTECKCFFALQIKYIPGSIGHGNRPGHEEWPVIFDNNFDVRHLKTFSG